LSGISGVAFKAMLKAAFENSTIASALVGIEVSIPRVEVPRGPPSGIGGTPVTISFPWVHRVLQASLGIDPSLALNRDNNARLAFSG